MKLNSFKFQDGKIFWLPEYPEKGPNIENFESYSLNGLSWFSYALAEAAYTLGIAKSLASAIEVAPEDRLIIKRLIVESVYKNGQIGDAIKVITSMWQPERDKVYSAECEMEIILENDCFHGECSCDAEDLNGQEDSHDECTHQSQVARLKPKDEIFPAANSHDMKDELK